jgi:two-component sensor histidine kinase
MQPLTDPPGDARTDTLHKKTDARFFDDLSRLNNELVDKQRELVKAQITISLQDEELRALNSELELRVEERTAELADANSDLVQEVRRRTEAEERVTADLIEKEILLREVHHRVKNNLQIIMSLLSLQSRKIQDTSLKMALRESQNRIKVMSYVHEKLFTSGDLGRVSLDGYFRFLVNNLFSLYQVPATSIALSLETHNVAVDINTAIPLGLVLNELISNSIRHAFSPGVVGEILISVQEDEQGSLHIVVRDNGRGLPQEFDRKNGETLWLNLVEGLVGQLDGTIVPAFNGGQQYTIDIAGKSRDGKGHGTFNPV